MSDSPTPAILTLTGNLLAERTLEFSDWAAGRTQRAQRESFQVGGKGINVSKMLQRLGAPTTALCFTGGATGSECGQWLGRQKFASQIFPTVHSTRVGIVIRGGAQPETTFFGPDVARRTPRPSAPAPTSSTPSPAGSSSRSAAAFPVGAHRSSSLCAPRSAAGWRRAIWSRTPTAHRSRGSPPSRWPWSRSTPRNCAPFSPRSPPPPRFPP